MVNQEIRQAQQMAAMEQGMAIEQNQMKQWDPYSPSYTESQEDLWRVLINPEVTLRQLELTSQGYTYNENLGKWEKKYPAMMNQEGLGTFMFALRNIISTHTIVSNLKEADVNTRCKHLRNELVIFLGMNYNRIGLSKEVRGLTLNCFDNTIKSAFSRGENATQLKLLGTSTKRLESFIQRPEQVNPANKGFNLFKT